jgi:long-chain acyl-CoA synthetase
VSIARWLEASAARTPNAPALYRGKELVGDYEDFAGRVASGAHRLNHLGVRPGDRVAIDMPNSGDYIIAMWSVWWTGAVLVPINAKLHAHEAMTILGDCEPAAVIVDDRRTAMQIVSAGERQHRTARAYTIVNIQERFTDLDASISATAPTHRNPDDLAWLFYTSGTTGAPKGVMLDHANLEAMSLNYMTDVDRVDSTDTAVYAAPLSHGAGLYCPIHVRRGARHCVPDSRGFDAEEVLDLAHAHHAISMFAAPTMVRRLTDAAEKASGPNAGEGIKTLVYGGGPMYLTDIRRALDVFGNRFVQIYGQGESPMTVTTLTREDHAVAPETAHRLTTVGTASSAVDVRIVDQNGKPLPPGTIGEIAVAGPTVMRGYWRNETATAATLRDGWLLTGDQGYLDQSGYLTLSGRSKEVIISGGTNIYPREVEDVLVAHEDIAEAAVIGVFDPEWGESVAALVVAEAGAALHPEALDHYCLSRLARFKRPRQYLLVDELPKNSYGKVVRRELSDIFTKSTPEQIATV